MSTRTRRLAEQRRQERRRRFTIAGMAAAAVVVVVILLVSVIGGGDSTSGGGDATGTVSMTEMAFDPDPIEATAGEAVLRVVNDGAVEHSLVVPDLGKGTPDLQPGQELDLDLRQAEAGEYYVYCDIAGHREAGMETTLTLG